MPRGTRHTAASAAITALVLAVVALFVWAFVEDRIAASKTDRSRTAAQSAVDAAAHQYASELTAAFQQSPTTLPAGPIKNQNIKALVITNINVLTSSSKAAEINFTGESHYTDYHFFFGSSDTPEYDCYLLKLTTSGSRQVTADLRKIAC